MISKTALHAIRAMVVLAQQPGGTHAGAGHIARAIDAPPNYLGKLLQTLAQEGLVQSQKGLGGGFCLARPARGISLFDVVDLIDNISRWEGCLLGQAVCSEENPCAVHHRWKKIRKAYLTMLRKTTIADLVAQETVLA